MPQSKEVEACADIETLRLAALTKLRDEQVAVMLAAAVEQPPAPPMSQQSRWRRLVEWIARWVRAR